MSDLFTIIATTTITLLTWDSSGFDANQVQSPTVVCAEGEYKLYYAGLPFCNTLDLGLAVSKSGASFQRISEEQLILERDEPSWASFRFVPVTAMYEDGRYRLWFNGNDTNLFTEPGNTHGFGHASSADGIDWSVGRRPIRVQEGPREGARLVEVVKTGGRYIAYYLDMNPSADDVLMRAVSPDGHTFADDARVDFGAEYTLRAATTIGDAVLALWSKDGAHYLAQSTDGRDFTLTHSVELPENFNVNDIRVGSGYITFYGARGLGNVTWDWGNVEIQAATSKFPTSGYEDDSGGDACFVLAGTDRADPGFAAVAGSAAS